MLNQGGDKSNKQKAGSMMTLLLFFGILEYWNTGMMEL